MVSKYIYCAAMTETEKRVVVEKGQNWTEIDTETW